MTIRAQTRIGAVLLILIFLAAFGRAVRCSVEQLEPVPLDPHA